jgi:murein DD-endopeptidase MepM/ murein hydrolase activator NlpD
MRWLITRYCHLADAAVKQGDSVKRGQVIGSIGYTGWRAKPGFPTGHEHVHWELILGSKEVDPLPYTVGCFDPRTTYPAGRFTLVLTYPVEC